MPHDDVDKRQSNDVVGGHAGAPLCPYKPDTASSLLSVQRLAATGNDGNNSNNSAATNVLASAMSSGGKGAARKSEETRGKKLLVGEVRLDRHLPGWEYKISLNQERLLPKNDPTWTVWLEIPIGESITLEVLARDLCSNDKKTGFVSIHSETFQPLEFFKVSSVDFASGRLPVGWLRAPDLAVVLEMRLEADASHKQGIFGRGHVSTRSCDVQEKISVLSRQDSSNRGMLLFGKEATTLVTVPPLTDVEIVIVKDSYNKALAWVDVVMEFIVERMYFLLPTLPDTLGDLAPNLQRHLHGIIDLAVRALDPATEDISRESYGAVHPSPGCPHQNITGYAQMLAEQGFLLTHWEIVRDLWMEALRSSPYMEAYELQNMELGIESAAYRFFTLHVIKPMWSAIATMEDVYEESSNAQMLADSWLPYAQDPKAMWAIGVEFYERLFARYPNIVHLFRGADMDSLSTHLAQTLVLVAQSFGDIWSVMPMLHHLGAVHVDLGIPASAHDKLTEVLMSVLSDRMEGFSGDSEKSRHLRRLWEQAWRRMTIQVRLPMDNAERLISKAYEWIDQASHELRWDEGYTKSRKGHIYTEVISRGTYSHTTEELVHGSRVCWRNSAKCIGRIAWNTLTVRDKRHVSDLDEVFAECMEHQRLAMADGSIKSVMTVFRPQAPGDRMGTRFWNSQLTRYAAYTLSNGSVIGDRANLGLTEAVMLNGWVPPEPKGHFDVLPIVLETASKEIRMFDVPPGYAREVPLEHPNYPEFAKLGLKWGAVPSITNFTMCLGGINYTTCPFNGWFMNTEVARDLMEDGRCARSYDIAKSFGLKVSDTDPFWRDRTFLELNFAVVHSFRKNAASIVDHHTASQQFLTHDLREKRVGRECPAQWSWIVPPLGGSLTSVFHHEMRHFDKDPRFVYQAEIFTVKRSEHAPVSAGHVSRTGGAKKRVLVLYGSETGTAEGYAYETAARLSSFACSVAPLDDHELSSLTASDVHAVLVVMSTFGDGGMPHGAKDFYEKAQRLAPGAMTGVRYSLMALGSSAYPDFCMAGKSMDRLWRRLGATAISKACLGNELDGQAQSVRDWQNVVENELGVGPAQARGLGEEPPETAGIVVLEADSKEVRSALSDPANFVRKGFSLCRLENNDELLNPATDTRSTRNIEIDLLNAPALAYQTGDHASVLPSNDPILVAGILKRIGANHSQWFTINGNRRPPFPVPTTVARAFVHELDLCTREPIGGLLELFLKRASDDLDKRKIEALLERQGKEDWGKNQKEFLNKYTTVLDILNAFPSVNVSAEDLIVSLPLVKARHYSISSAAEVQPRRLQLTVGVLKVFDEKKATWRKGLCSHYLARQKRGELVRVAVRPSKYRAPTDLTSSPVIMVGPGTGISPMLGFLQARADQKRKGTILAPCLVYFGCRDSTEFLHSEQLREWHKQGVITGLHVAMSREGPKTYVQDLIGKQEQTVWELMRDPKCYTYVCGDSSMAEDVKAKMMLAALRCSSMDRLAVVEHFKAMRKEGRLQSDTWGVGLHGATAVDTFLATQATQELWQAQVQAAKALASPPFQTGSSIPIVRVFDRLMSLRSANPDTEATPDPPNLRMDQVSKDEGGTGHLGEVGPARNSSFLRRSLPCRMDGGGLSVDQRPIILLADTETE